MFDFAEFAASLGLTELQLSLALIGFTLLLVVMIYNAFRLRKSEKQDIEFNQLNPEVNFVEPSFSSLIDEKQEPSLGLAQQNNAVPYQAPGLKIDSLIDCVIALRFQEPISGEEILDHLSAWPKNVLHPWMCEGLLSQSVGTDGVWEVIQVGHNYLELQTAIQLANRRGPIGIVDLSDFTSRSQALANALDAEIDLPPVNDVLEEAKSLDQFAAQSDIQLGITIVPKANLWNLAEIKNAATKAGFQLARDGRQFQRIIHNQSVYILIADEANFLRDDLSKPVIDSVTLLLDLPKVSQSIDPFKTMLADAQLLAESIGGDLVDDAGRPLVSDAIDAINTQLNEIYKLMFEHGIAAGSITAQRLFS